MIEEERKRKEEENATSCKSRASDLINSKPNSALSHSPLVTAPAEKRENKRKEKVKDHVTHYYPPSPVYVASYEENAPTLANSLVPRPTPTPPKKATNKMKESKTAVTEETG